MLRKGGGVREKMSKSFVKRYVIHGQLLPVADFYHLYEKTLIFAVPGRRLKVTGNLKVTCLDFIFSSFQLLTCVVFDINVHITC